jgi:ABC-type uncharacterized transport system permease subunit
MITILGISLSAFAVLCLIALAGLIPARAGVMDIGLEGKMAMSAFMAVAVCIRSDSALLGVAAAVGTGLLTGLLSWFLSDVLGADPVIVGVGFTSLGLGGATLAASVWLGTDGTVRAPSGIPAPAHGVGGWLHDLVGDLSIIAWMTPLILVACFFLIHRSRFGLRLTALGDSPASVTNAGYRPKVLRLYASLLGGCLAGLAGVELTLGGVGVFTPGMTAGRGFIGLAAVLLGASTVWGTAAACLFFGLAEGLAVHAQVSGFSAVPVDLVAVLPYALTVFAVCLLGRRRLSVLPNRAKSQVEAVAT